MTVQTFNTLTGNFNSHGGTEADNNAVSEKGTARVEDHTRVDSFNVSSNFDTSADLYFKHPTSERHLSAAEAYEFNANVVIGGMETTFQAAQAAGLIDIMGEPIAPPTARTDPAPQHTGEDMVDVGDTVTTGLSEDSSAALGLVNATVESSDLVDMVLSASDSGEFDINYVNELSEAIGSDSSKMANHLLAEGLASFQATFGDSADMAQDYFYQNRNTPEVRDAIAGFIGGRGMSGFEQILKNL